MEQKRPLTRSILDDMISVIEKELDDAVANKEYTKCPPLQEKLDSLLKKREDLPTIDELRQKLKEAEDAVNEAAASKDYVVAASKQAAVNEARKRLEEAMNVDGIDKENDLSDSTKSVETKMNGVSFSSRADLESHILTTKKEVEHQNF